MLHFYDKFNYYMSSDDICSCYINNKITAVIFVQADSLQSIFAYFNARLFYSFNIYLVYEKLYVIRQYTGLRAFFDRDLADREAIFSDLLLSSMAG